MPATPTPSPEESRLDSALRSADTMLLDSLRREDRHRKKRRTLILVAIFGGIPMLALALYAALNFPLHAPPAPILSTAVTPTVAASAAAPAPSVKLPTFKIKDAVEVKSGGKWDPAVILKKDGDIYQIRYDRFAKINNPAFFDEWVTLDRIRTPGDTRDIPFAMPTPHAQKPTPERRAEALKVFDPSPAAAATPPTPAPSMPDTSTPTPAGPPQTPVDFSHATHPIISDTFTYKPDALSLSFSHSGNGIPLAAPTGAFFEKPGDFLITPTGKAALSFINAEPGKPAQTRVDLLDLSANKHLATIALPPGTKLAAISPDSSLIALLQSNFQPGTNTRIDILSLAEGGKSTPVVSFSPHASESWAASDITWASFLDNSYLLTLSSGRKLTLWSIPQPRAVWTTDLDTGTPVLSTTGKYLLVLIKNKATLLETATGESAGILPIKFPGLAQFAFKPDGTRLAALLPGKLQIFDLRSNSLANEIILPNLPFISSLGWADDDHLLLGNEYLINLKLGLLTWHYTSAGIAIAQIFTETMFFASLPSPRAHAVNSLLYAANVPDRSVLAAESKIDLSQAFILKPGATVSLQVDLAGQGDPAQVTAALSAKFAANHITVADNQPLVIRAAITTGKTHDMNYSDMTTGQKQALSVTDLVLSLQLLANNAPVWSEDSNYAAPYSIFLKPGQSIQQYIDDQKAAAWKYFLTADLPPRIPAPHTPPGFGESSFFSAQ